MKKITIIQSNVQETTNSAVIEKLYNLAFEDQANGIYSQLDPTSNVSGNIVVPAAYEDAVRYLAGIDTTDVPRFPNLHITVQNNNYYVRLTDPVIAQHCINEYGDGVGVTRSNLAGVTSRNSSFFGHGNFVGFDKSTVTSLDDFQYFIGLGGWDDVTITGYTNATSVKFPPITFTYGNIYSKSVIHNCYNIQNVDYGDATFMTSSTGTINTIYGNNVITDFSPNLIPNQTNFSNICLFGQWSKLQSIVFPEGVTNTSDKFRAMSSLLYVEYPTTIQTMGDWYEVGRDGSNSYVVVIKSTTPPDAYYHPNDNSNNQDGWNWHKLPTAIYVPDSAVNTYKTVTPLSIGTGTNEKQLIWCSQDIIDRITPLSELPVSVMQYSTVTQADIDRV